MKGKEITEKNAANSRRKPDTRRGDTMTLMKKQGIKEGWRRRKTG